VTDRQLELEVKRLEIVQQIKNLEVDLEVIDHELSKIEKAAS
jgi:hypothetical protein